MLSSLFQFAIINNFSAFTTLIVGTFVFIIWKLKNREEKRNIARIIVNEIRSSEKTIEKISNMLEDLGSGEYPSIYLSNAWFNHSSLFAADLDQDQFDEINEFFGICRDLNEFLSKDNNFLWIGTEKIAEIYIEKMAETIFKIFKNEKVNLTDKKYKDEVSVTKKKLAAFAKSVRIYFPKKTLSKIKQILTSYKEISTATSALKLKQIAYPKNKYSQ